MPSVKTRFAPSPTGRLHLGNVRTALFSWLAARHAGGRFLLRIEDTDAERGAEHYIDALVEDLVWLGLDWQEGPGADQAQAPYRQSARGARYDRHFVTLIESGQAYRCFCTEHELEIARRTQIASGRPPRYSGRCRALTPAQVSEKLAAGAPSTLRFRMPEEGEVTFEDGVRGPQRFVCADIGDFVIRRSDGSAAFFFSNAVDDAEMGITHVVRGEDHLTNTPRQILLQRALGLAVPAYAHLPLVMGADGSPLSKRNGSRSLDELRQEGFLPLAILNYLARLGHTIDNEGLLDAAGLAQAFDFARVHHAAGRFDAQHLLHWQRLAVQAADSTALRDWMQEALDTRVPAAEGSAFVEAVRGNVVFPADARHWAERIYAESLVPASVASEVIRAAGADFFAAAAAALAQHGTDFRAFSAQVKQATGQAGKALFQPLRAALTGELDGPEMAKLLPLIGRERAGRRIERALNER
jgi:glutamyl-tRNA synthetase